jgi:hypothetical protein
MNYIDGLFVPIPVPVVDLEQIPLPVPPIGHESALHLYNQIPNELKLNGFGYYMRQYDNSDDMPDNQLYQSYLANYYYFNHHKQLFSFYDWQEAVRAKVGGYRPDIVFPNYVDWIIDEVNAGRISMVIAATNLFTRHQLLYYGW